MTQHVTVGQHTGSGSHASRRTSQSDMLSMNPDDATGGSNLLGRWMWPPATRLRAAVGWQALR
jgi:hypothetical protein